MGDPQEDITAFWSMVAPHYEADPANVPVPGTDAHAAWVRRIEEALPPAPLDVLDVATGTGFVAGVVASLGHRVTGVDISPAMLDHARRSIRGVTFVEGDAVDPPVPPASFDVVTNRFLLWTLREPQAAFARWRALLRPGGRLVVFDGFWFDEEPDIYAEGTRRALPFHAERDPQIVAAALERAGFADVTVTALTEIENTPHRLVAR